MASAANGGGTKTAETVAAVLRDRLPAGFLDRVRAAPTHLRLRDLPALPASSGGWVLLGERPEEEMAHTSMEKYFEFVE